MASRKCQICGKPNDAPFHPICEGCRGYIGRKAKLTLHQRLEEIETLKLRERRHEEVAYYKANKHNWRTYNAEREAIASDRRGGRRIITMRPARRKAA